MEISRDPYQCSPLSAAQLGVLVGILSGLSVSVLCSRGCEFLLAPDFGLLMRDPTSLFPSLGFPRGGLCLRCSRVPFALPFLFVLPWLGWEGIRLLLFRVLFVLPTLAYLFSSSCFLSYPFFLALPSLPCLAWLCCATAALGVLSVSALSVSCPCLSSDLGQNAVLYVLGEFFCIPCATRLSSLWITPYFLWISTYLLCTAIPIFIVLSIYSFRSFYMLSSYEVICLSVSFPVFLQLFMLFLFFLFFSFFWERLLAGASFPRYLATYSKALSVSSSPLQPKSTQLAISGDLASPCIPHFVRNRSLSFDAIPQYMFYQQISTVVLPQRITSTYSLLCYAVL